MCNEPPFQAFLQQVRQGDVAAAAALIQQYEPCVRQAVRRYLASSRLRRVLDSVDISQSVFAHFLPRLSDGNFELTEPEQMRKLLVTMARNKFRDHLRRQHAARRGGGQADVNASEVLAALPSAAESVSQAVMRRECVEEIRRRLTQDERELAEERASGREWAEIAAQRGEKADAVRKRLRRAADRLGPGLA